MKDQDDVRRRREHTANIESLEARLALTAAPLAHFSPDALYASSLRTEAEQQLLAAGSLADAHSVTNMHSVFQNYGLYGTGQTIAVIDSGIAYDHPAFGNAGFGAGYRVVGGWDFAENDANPYDDAPAGFHGTHVAGIIGSRDADNPGVAQGVDLVSLRVFDDKGNGSFSWVEQALQWVHDHRNSFANPITTINLSLGTNWNSTTVPNWATLENEFRQLMNDGIFIAVAAGNSFQNYGTTGLSYPAASPYVVPVGSVNMDGTVSYFSQRDDRALFAPGQNIRSTIPDAAGNNNHVADDWATASGTSMATPYMAGVSSLVREAMQISGKTNITENDIYDVLRRTADRVWDGATGQYYLRINVGRAIDAAMPAADSDSAGSPTANLGVLRSSASASGQIERKADTDYFTFTAGASGVVRVSASTKFEVVSQWGVVGASGQMKDGAYEFRVEAGKQYTITLGTSKGVGNYSLTATLTADAQQPPASNPGNGQENGQNSGNNNGNSSGGQNGGGQNQQLALSISANPTSGATLNWNVQASQGQLTILNRMTGAVVYQGSVSGTSWNGQLAAGNYTAQLSVNGQAASQNFSMATRILGITYDVSATGQTSVRWNAMNGASFYQVRVLNSLGQRVSEFQTSNTSFNINLSGGNYMISISPNARGSEMVRADIPASTSQMAQATGFSLYSSGAALGRMSLDGGTTAVAQAELRQASITTESVNAGFFSQYTEPESDTIGAIALATPRIGDDRRDDSLFDSLATRAEAELGAVDELFGKFGDA